MTTLSPFSFKQYTDQDAKLALLRQALAGNQWAWTDFYQSYYRLVLSWIGRRIKDPEEVEEIALCAWEKFAQAMSLQKLANFRSFSQVMVYLQRCTCNTVADVLRSKRSATRVVFVPLEEIGDLADEHDDFSGEPSYPELIQFVLAELSNAREQLLFKLLFVYKWTPAEIAKRYQHQFCSADAVYDARRLLMKRLRRNKALRALAGREEESIA